VVLSFTEGGFAIYTGDNYFDSEELCMEKSKESAYNIYLGEYAGTQVLLKWVCAKIPKEPYSNGEA